MELTYIVIAAILIALPFILTRLFSGGGKKDATSVLGASTPRPAKTQVSAESALLSDEVKALLVQGQKIEAIKVVRERTGFPLAAAKDMVEMIGKGGSLSMETKVITSTTELARETTAELRRLISQGDKVGAIKFLRDHTGLGLKEAKDVVEKLG